MVSQIFVNLPVRDLNRSKDFFSKLGFSFNLQFSNDTAICMVISESIYAMLLTHSKFKEFTPKEISDATKTTEVLTALAVGSKEKVHEIVDAAIQAGGSEARPAEDYDFMYSRSFNDLDGHIWEIFWMDPTAFPEQA